MVVLRVLYITVRNVIFLTAVVCLLIVAAMTARE